MSESREQSAEQLRNYYRKHSELGSATTSTGNPIPEKDSSLTIGKYGPILLEDWELLDELSHFVRERVPERVVHAKGAGAFGYFEVTHDITDLTVAKVFNGIGKQTRTAVRFSTVAGNLGAADTVRDPRGFAVKFYTDDGIWDLVGNNTPIFFIRDPVLFPHFIHSQKRNPVTNVRDWDMFWDFISLRPETTHQVMFLFADRGIPDGFRHMHGFGSHTFTLINKDKNVTFCKFHFQTDQGIKNLDVQKATKLAGEEPDYALKDLYNAIASGECPSWTLRIQTMTHQQATECDFNPFDVTKVWPHGLFPLRPVGKLVLNKNPTNFFSEVEQLSFSPASLIPGISASQDRMLQGRLFSYHDAHIYRLGVNFTQLPVNCPFRVTNFQRDGLNTVNSQGGAPNYHPNSFGGPNSDERAKKYYRTYKAEGVVERYDTKDDDNFTQARVFYQRVLDEAAKTRLIDNIVTELKKANREIQLKTVANFTQVDASLGKRIKDGLKLIYASL
ncbi:PREDICTED: catalase-like [Nicrophorus vespilloides]|uniref:Catalase n=1 Tax=Nicrophorus vespilloides TaxID=110193 RepID=A0ABM1N713_NICVS|nr:PREDICTED: catalase-like [Nicrophorus vespilloides]